jgi:flavin reductase (DIM6/NTAB) family NADH-FMN oxidoreductase RutF
MGHFATGIAVVTSFDDDGRPVGTTVTAVSSLSLSPPLLLVCLESKSVTLRAIRCRGAFAVNVLGAENEDLSSNFARRGTSARWEDVKHAPARTGCPALRGALVTLDCILEHEVHGGDHEILVGRIVDTIISDDPTSTPLLHYRGAYARLLPS